MKHLFLPLMLAIVMAACTAQESTTEMPDVQQMIKSGEFKGTWKLSKMVASWGNQETPASDFDYEEFYEFASDGSFRKYRNTGESDKGTYEVKELSDGMYVIATFEEGAELIVSCMPGQEALKIGDDGTLVGGALPCDGPALYFAPQTESKQ